MKQNQREIRQLQQNRGADRHRRKLWGLAVLAETEEFLRQPSRRPAPARWQAFVESCEIH